MNKTIVLILLLMLYPVLIFAGGQTEASVETTITGVVEYLEGDVTINGEPADFGMKVPFGAVVETGFGAYCEIVFEGKNIFRVQEDTLAEIRLSTENPEIKVERGALASLFTKLGALTQEDYFRVKTQTATAGVRGTAFFVKVLSPENTYICICNGELEMTEPDGKKAGTLSSGHHKAYYYKLVDGQIEISEAPLLYHSDEDMESLADHIKESIPWYY